MPAYSPVTHPRVAKLLEQEARSASMYREAVAYYSRPYEQTRDWERDAAPFNTSTIRSLQEAQSELSQVLDLMEDMHARADWWEASATAQALDL